MSPATTALQTIAKAGRSQQAPTWAVFPVFGQDLVVAGYLSARTPLSRDHAFAIEPGGALATAHDVVRVVGVRMAGVDASTPLVLAPPPHGPGAEVEHAAAVRETRAVLASDRPFGWYFVAGDSAPA